MCTYVGRICPYLHGRRGGHIFAVACCTQLFAVFVSAIVVRSRFTLWLPSWLASCSSRRSRALVWFASASVMAPYARSPPVPTFPIVTGLHKTELVLRGGFLDTPAVLTGLRVVEGRQYVTLHKHNKTLVRFLTGKATFRRPLARTAIIEGLMAARALKQKTLIADSEASVESAAPGDDDDDDLDLADGPKSSAVTPAKRTSWRKAFVNKTQLPLADVVEVLRPGSDPFRPRMLLSTVRGNEAVAIEATADNLEVVLCAVRDDESSVAPSGTTGGGEPRKRPPRKLDDGSREYFIRGRWVNKRRERDEAGAVKVRTLLRRPTDEPPKAGRRRARQTGSGLAPSGAFRQIPVKVEVDDLNLDL